MRLKSAKRLPLEGTVLYSEGSASTPKWVASSFVCSQRRSSSFLLGGCWMFSTFLETYPTCLSFQLKVYRIDRQAGPFAFSPRQSIGLMMAFLLMALINFPPFPRSPPPRRQKRTHTYLCVFDVIPQFL
ncbi:hypothetical protein NPIL_543521 [Nephila pilipes]|uniref:Uncharacterized protein n=1 Tax=Nephila pilipes TaxID=299642 RepID=A0A8X6MUV1_NEPPI|nr:hypothetical protein NPIL_543521 [Nephila pilipes]